MNDCENFVRERKKLFSMHSLCTIYLVCSDEPEWTHKESQSGTARLRLYNNTKASLIRSRRTALYKFVIKLNRLTMMTIQAQHKHSALPLIFCNKTLNLIKFPSSCHQQNYKHSSRSQRSRSKSNHF